MNSTLDKLFQQPGKGYLKPKELGLVSKYVSSLPERIKLYRQLRSQEEQLLQRVVDQLPKDLTESPSAALEQSVKQAILMLRYVAMGMLVDDPDFARGRLQNWLPAMVEAYQTQEIDKLLYPQLLLQLSRGVTNTQLPLLKPGLEAAQKLLTVSEVDAVTHSMPLIEIG